MAVRTISFRNVGAPNTPQEIKRFRRENMDMCRRHGEPVILMHQFNNEDVDKGIAKTCPYDYDDDYGQVRENCPICFGVGFVSMEDQPDRWIDNDGTITDYDPGTHVHAPVYGGYGPRYLTWMVEPDKPVDIFKISDQGVMVQTQQAEGYAPWFPDLHDNDLAVNVILNSNGFTIADDAERFQLKMVNPVTLRGFGRRAQYQAFKVAQSFEMARVPDDNILQQVPLDIGKAYADASRATSAAAISSVDELDFP
jgi:hypothetical protein